MTDRTTSRTAATKGPWMVDRKEPGELWVSNAERTYPVCMVTAAGFTTERDEADARLIAAAPELYEALRNFTDGRNISYADALAVARAALSKAGGDR